jgi:hypothetical protein
MPKPIDGSVGRGGRNFPAKDVLTVQYLLNCVPAGSGGFGQDPWGKTGAKSGMDPSGKSSGGFGQDPWGKAGGKWGQDPFGKKSGSGGKWG